MVEGDKFTEGRGVKISQVTFSINFKVMIGGGEEGGSVIVGKGPMHNITLGQLYCKECR